MTSSLSTRSRTFRSAAAATCLVLLATCSTPSTDDPAPGPTSETFTVTGLITELEADSLSLRATDGRQFIFLIEDHDLARLKDLMEQQTEVKVTYRIVDSRLVPMSIETASETASN